MLLTATLLLLFKTYKSWTLLTHEGTCQKSYVRGRSQWIPMGYKETQKYNKHRPIFLLENIFTYKNSYRISRLNTIKFENKITLMRLVMLSGIYCILLQTPNEVWGGG